MADLCDYAGRPFSFIFRYVRLRPIPHAVILCRRARGRRLLGRHAIRRQVSCRHTLQPQRRRGLDRASALLGSLIAADNLLWRLASWIANSAFVGVTGDLRRDLFRHLTGHSPELFRRAFARHADEPGDRNIKRGVHRREHVCLERPAPVRGNCSQRSPWSSPSACRWLRA